MNISEMTKDYKTSKVIKRDKKCVYCNSTEKLTADHVIPLSKGRCQILLKRELNNYGNLVATCEYYNRSKGNNSLEEFLKKDPLFKKNFLEMQNMYQIGFQKHQVSKTPPTPSASLHQKKN